MCKYLHDYSFRKVVSSHLNVLRLWCYYLELAFIKLTREGDYNANSKNSTLSLI